MRRWSLSDFMNLKAFVKLLVLIGAVIAVIWFNLLPQQEQADPIFSGSREAARPDSVDEPAEAPREREFISPVQKISEEHLAGPTIPLQPEVQISGVVIDQRTKSPIAGAQAASLALIPRSEQMDGFDLGALGCMTGKEGRFILLDVPDEMQTIIALHPDYAQGFARCRPSDSIVIEMVQGYRISGHVRCDNGEPCSGGIVTVRGMLDPFGRRSVTDEEGFYNLPLAAPGEHFIHVTGPLGSDDPSFTPEFANPLVEDRDLILDFGPKPDDATVAGRLFGPDEALSIKNVKIVFSRIGKEVLIRHGRLDNSGNYRLQKLEPGRYRVEADFHASGDRVSLGEWVIPNPGLHRMDFRLPGGIVAGRALTGEASVNKVEIQLWPADLAMMRSLDADEDGSFCFFGVSPEKYKIIAFSDSLGHFGSREIEVSENETLHLELKYTPLGTLRVKLIGWESCRKDEYRYLVRPVGMKDFTQGNEFSLDDLEAGETVRENRLDPGEYEISFHGLELPSQHFWILEEQSTEILFDLRSLDMRFTCFTGILIDEAGRPLGGAYVSLSREVQEEGSERFVLFAGPDGKFEIPALQPGLWKMKIVDARDKESPHLHDLLIPSPPPRTMEKKIEVGYYQ